MAFSNVNRFNSLLESAMGIISTDVLSMNLFYPPVMFILHLKCPSSVFVFFFTLLSFGAYYDVATSNELDSKMLKRSEKFSCVLSHTTHNPDIS